MERDKLVDEFVDGNRKTFRLWSGKLYDAIAREDVSPALAGMLLLLEQKQPLPSAAIAKELCITKGAVAQFTESLFKLGYVERQADTKDRRITYIALSRKGIKKARRLARLRKGLFRQMTTSLTDEELIEATRINAKLRQVFEQHTP